MRNTTPKKVIGLKPKFISPEENKPNPPIRHIQKLYSPPPSTYMPPKILQPQYHPPRLSSPPLPPTNHNITVRPISTKAVEIGSPRQSLTNTIDVHNRIPPLVFKKPQIMHSPKFVDSIVISKQEHPNKVLPTEVFREKQISKTINYINKFPSQTSLQPKDSPRRDITASKLREKQLPIRYEPLKDRFSEKYSDSLTNISDIRVQESPVKVQQHYFQQQIQIQHYHKQQQQQHQYLVSNETLASSSNKLAALTKKMAEIVKINQNYESKLSQIQQSLHDKDNQNKKMRKKITQLTQKSKQIKKQCQKMQDEHIQYKSKVQSQIDSFKIQYGSDLFKSQTQLNNLLTIRKNTQNNLSLLQKQQIALSNQLYEFRELFKSIQSGFSQVNI